MVIAKNVNDKLEYVCGRGQVYSKNMSKLFFIDFCYLLRHVVLDRGKYYILA